MHNSSKMFRAASDTPWGPALSLKSDEKEKVVKALETIKSQEISSNDLEDVIQPAIDRARGHGIILPADLADAVEIAKKLEKNEEITKAVKELSEINNTITINPAP